MNDLFFKKLKLATVIVGLLILFVYEGLTINGVFEKNPDSRKNNISDEELERYLYESNQEMKNDNSVTSISGESNNISSGELVSGEVIEYISGETNIEQLIM